MDPTNAREEPEIDCIDLNNAENEYESITTYRSVSPTISMKTVSEFEEPDNKGHAKVKNSSPSMIGQIQTVMGSVIGSGQGRQNAAKSARRPSSSHQDFSEEDLCSHCGSTSKPSKNKSLSCWALIFLLAVDAFTIGLILVLYSHHTLHTGIL